MLSMGPKLCTSGFSEQSFKLGIFFLFSIYCGLKTDTLWKESGLSSTEPPVINNEALEQRAETQSLYCLLVR